MTRRIVAVAAALAVLAGCGQARPTPAATATAPTPSASPSVAAATSPSPQPTATPIPIPLPRGSEAIPLDPAQFPGIAIDNPYWPLAPGNHWVYSETDGEGAVQQVDVTVLAETKDILGIRAT